MVTIFFYALVFGFVFCLSPGAVLAETLRRGLLHGFTSALLVQIGSLVGDAAWAVIGLTGIALLIEHEAVRVPLTNLPVGRAVWKPAPDFATSAAAWLTAGAAHHTVMSTAVGIEVFQDFAEMARTELLVIDENTELREFSREVRWNQAYYRLAQGL